MTDSYDFWRGDSRITELQAEVERLREQVAHWRANHDSQLAKKRKVSKLYGDLLRSTRKGTADWIFDRELGVHVPSCTVQVRGPHYWDRCGNGPLEGDQILTGDCGEHDDPDDAETWRHADGSVRVDHMDSRPGDYCGTQSSRPPCTCEQFGNGVVSGNDGRLPPPGGCPRHGSA